NFILGGAYTRFCSLDISFGRTYLLLILFTVKLKQYLSFAYNISFVNQHFCYIALNPGTKFYRLGSFQSSGIAGGKYNRAGLELQYGNGLGLLRAALHSLLATSSAGNHKK